VELIEPDQLADAITDTRRKSWGGEEIDSNTEKLITDDMVANGLMDEGEEESLDWWLNPHPEKGTGRYTDDSAMTGEFAPDEDLAEWDGF
jgi:hypothetical protein